MKPSILMRALSGSAMLAACGSNVVVDGGPPGTGGAAGAATSTSGITTSGTFPCGQSAQCSTGQEYCSVLEGFTVTYQCQPVPASCLAPNAAVCGCMPTPPDCGSCTGAPGQITVTHGCG